ncbi:deoxynucleotidyltransferase terminal-interacting protein 2 [Diabrotica virgifera virgifera]|uniref:Fcf2 pre-rRNA processing C-terminal domain-containing protein n=1 Tax=Diabrotica virgifera virgifera TaxID=50390 RepID=A0ABM5IIT0_DIAVI|nr:deoxynucleotidyltransferase terminal-interacting protein 2 [Diabrotica virgifera virgifera]
MDTELNNESDAELSELEDNNEEIPNQIEESADSSDSEKSADDIDFVIDKEGVPDSTQEKSEKEKLLDEIFKDCPISFKEKKPKVKKIKKNSFIRQTLADLGFNDDGTLRSKPHHKQKKLLTKNQRDEVKKALKKSVITPEFEKLHVVPPLDVSEKKLKEQRKKERSLTKGSKWYGLPATELTDEVKRDLEVLQMRSVLDPKHFYKKNDLKVLPKYFQVGKVMDSPLDYYNNRLTKKERKKTLVDELLADAEFNKYNKRKYKEIITEKQQTHYKAWRQAKRLKKKK